MEAIVNFTPAIELNEDITLRFKVSRYNLDNEVVIEAIDEFLIEVLDEIEPLVLTISDCADMPDVMDPEVCKWIMNKFQSSETANKVCIINNAGTEAIKAFLKKNHKHYAYINVSGFDFNKYLNAWIEEAQSKWENTGVCSIELQNTESINGRTIVFDLPDDCYDLRSIDDNGNII